MHSLVFWLAPRLSDFSRLHPEIEVNLMVTQSFVALGPGARPDVIICKLMTGHDGYDSQPLFSDVIYPVCSPCYLEAHPGIQSVKSLRGAVLLDLKQQGSFRTAELVDWRVWLAHHDSPLDERAVDAPRFLSANDYDVLIQLALNHQGIVLGWHHFVAPLIEKGSLVRPFDQQLVCRNTFHYLRLNQSRAFDPSCRRLIAWLRDQANNSHRLGLAIT